MENKLSDYLGKELKNIISSVQVFQGTARESGTPYYAIDIYFINGYQKRLFLKSDEVFAWVNAIQQAESQVQVDANF